MKIKDFEGNFREIEGFEGYFVSDLGTVYSAGSDKLLSAGDPGTGHLMVVLRKEGKSFSKHVHRLVAEAFIEKPADAEVVHHLDHNQRNNNVTNLCWLSKEKHDQLHVEARGGGLPGKPKIKILCHQNNKVYDSMNDAAKDLSLSISQLSMHINGLCKAVKGYTFSKVEVTDEG